MIFSGPRSVRTACAGMSDWPTCTPSASQAKATSTRSFIRRGTPWDRQIPKHALAASTNSRVSASFSLEKVDCHVTNNFHVAKSRKGNDQSWSIQKKWMLQACSKCNIRHALLARSHRRRTNLSWTMVAPPSMAALTASVRERPHFLFILESVTAYRNRSFGLKYLLLHGLLV